MCNQVACGLKYKACGCFDVVKTEFVDCLSETCTSSLCHPVDCVGYLCICNRKWQQCRLQIVEFVPGACSLCYEPDVVPSPQIIRRRSMLRSSLHSVNVRFSTITKEPSKQSLKRPGSRPESRRTIASLADYGYGSGSYPSSMGLP